MWAGCVGHSTKVDNFRDWHTLPIVWFLELVSQWHYPLSSQVLKSLFFFFFSFQILPDAPVFLLVWLTGSLKFLATQPAPVGHSVPCCKRVSA